MDPQSVGGGPGEVQTCPRPDLDARSALERPTETGTCGDPEDPHVRRDRNATPWVPARQPLEGWDDARRHDLEGLATRRRQHPAAALPGGEGPGSQGLDLLRSESGPAPAIDLEQARIVLPLEATGFAQEACRLLGPREPRGDHRRQVEAVETRGAPGSLRMPLLRERHVHSPIDAAVPGRPHGPVAEEMDHGRAVSQVSLERGVGCSSVHGPIVESGCPWRAQNRGVAERHSGLDRPWIPRGRHGPAAPPSLRS